MRPMVEYIIDWRQVLDVGIETYPFAFSPTGLLEQVVGDTIEIVFPANPSARNQRIKLVPKRRGVPRLSDSGAIAQFHASLL